MNDINLKNAENNNFEYKIYVLYESQCPENIRYVGATVQSIKQRLKTHIKDAKKIKKNTQKYKDESYKAKWIRKCIRENISIEIKQIDSSSVYDEKLEIKWIKKYRELGYKLTNISNGGKAFMLGKHHSEECKQRIRNARLGVKVSEETAQKTRGRNNGWASPVLQYTKDGEFIKRWGCIKDAVASLKLNGHSGISLCCKLNKKIGAKIKTSNGFIWTYA